VVIASPVIAHRGARVGVAGGLLHVTQWNAGIQSGRDEGVPQRVRSHALVDAGVAGDPPHDPRRSVAVEAPPITAHDDRTVAAFADHQIDGAGGAWSERNRDRLTALAHHHQRAMPALEAEPFDVGLKGDRGYEAIQALRGVGPVLAAVFVAEIGDVTRFDNPRQLCSWAGLTPRHRESDAHTHRGHITKQGSRLLRWAAVEAVSGAARDRSVTAIKRRVGDRRGRNIGRVAAARHLLTLVYYGLRDGEIRCLATTDAA
jgi:hypothetical protein